MFFTNIVITNILSGYRAQRRITSVFFLCTTIPRRSIRLNPRLHEDDLSSSIPDYNPDEEISESDSNTSNSEHEIVFNDDELQHEASDLQHDEQDTMAALNADPAALQELLQQLIAQNGLLVQALNNARDDLNTATNQLNNDPQPAATTPLLDLHAAGTAYDLSTKAGLAAFDQAKAPLEHKYDGSNTSYPDFVNDLQLREQQCKWDQGNEPIVQFNAPDRNLFVDIGSITMVEIEAARNNRTDARATQNAKALYYALSHSMTGNLFSNFFGQAGNLPENEDGPTFFKMITDFTTIHSIRSSMDVTKELIAFDPAAHNYNIILINQAMTNLFLRANQGSFTNVNDAFKMFHLISVYEKILRPQEWVDFVNRIRREFENNALTDPKTLLRDAAAKYGELQSFTGPFVASTKSLQEDIIGLFATQMDKWKKGQPTEPKANVKSNGDDPPKSLPPFSKHSKVSLRTGEEHKEGDTKTWDGKTWYFHHATTHRDGRRWFTHLPSKCVTCIKFKRNISGNVDDGSEPPSANISDVTPETATTETPAAAPTTEQPPQDVRAFLASAYNSAQQGNHSPVLCTLIADAMSAFDDETEE